MAFEEQTFASREILTIFTGPAKLNALNTNNNALKAVLMYSLTAGLVDHGGKSSSSYSIVSTVPVYIETDFDVVHVGVLLYNTSGGANTMKITIGAASPIELSYTGSTPTLQTDDVDVSGLATGWHDVVVEMKNGGSGVSRFYGLTLMADCEGTLT